MRKIGVGSFVSYTARLPLEKHALYCGITRLRCDALTLDLPYQFLGGNPIPRVANVVGFVFVTSVFPVLGPNMKEEPGVGEPDCLPHPLASNVSRQALSADRE